MAKQESTHLKVFTEPAYDSPPLAPETLESGLVSMEALCEAFHTATGWPLEYSTDAGPLSFRPSESSRHDAILAWSAPVDPGDGTAPGHIRIGHGELASDEAPASDLSAAFELAGFVAELLNQLGEARERLRTSMAELAVLAPTVAYVGRGAELGERLEAVLHGGLAALDCQAAAMYLLDEETTELKLRAMCGLPRSRLIDPSRPVEDATADLEAMLGNAVVLTDDKLYDLWCVPEPDYGSAVCVPISSPSTVMGTFWIFSRSPREFEDKDTNLIEILAGRLAIELEREALLRECRRRKQ